MSAWVAGLTIAAGAAASIGGAAMTADATRDAQNSANKANAQAAAQQSAQSFQNYLSSRGVNLQQLLQKYPEFGTEYNRARASGEQRDFNTWIQAALQAQPGHPIWNDIANPTIGTGAQNTTLPAWALDANGQPLQPSLLNQLVSIYSGTNVAANAPVGTIANLQNVNALLESRPDLRAEIDAAREGSDDQRTTEQWLVDHITQSESQSGGGTFTTALRDFLTGQEAAAEATKPQQPTVNPDIMALQPGAINTAAGIFNGDLLKELQASLDPVAAARLAGADAQRAKIAEQRSLSENLKMTELGELSSVLKARADGAGNIYDATITGAGGVRDASKTAAQAENDAAVQKLSDLLGVRLEAAQAIYDASASGNASVRDARTAGAKNIYDSELLRADTYAQSAEQSLNRMLAAQAANRARQGFSGGSSGSDLTRARLMADYVQRGAGARADAGVGYQTRLSDAGVGYATDMRGTDVNRATTIGQSSEQDAQARLQAAVQLARSLGAADVGYATTAGNAGVTRAGTVASATEADAVGRLTAIVDDARRKMGYLTSDADIAAAQAQEQNALDALNALVADQNRRTGSIGLPWSLGQQDLALKTQNVDNKYEDIDALLQRLQYFGSSQASGPTIATPTVQPVINNGQIVGGALSGLGSAIGTYSNNQAIMDAIAKYRTGTAQPAPAYAPQSSYVPITGSGNYLSGASVFKGP
jgi:hypothetical protein